MWCYAYCIASTSENCSALFTSYCMKVFLVFFFFFGADFVAAHRIVWYGMDVSLGSSGLAAAIDAVVILLNGAMTDLVCAMIVAVRRVVLASTSKVQVGASGRGV